MPVKRVGFLAVALALLAAGGWLLWPRPVRAVFLDLEPGAAWQGIPEDSRTGLHALVQDALELDPSLTVLPERPTPETHRPWRRLVLGAQRHGDELRITLSDEAGPAAEAAGAPAEAIRRVLDSHRLQTRDLSRLLPGDPAAFWALADLAGPFNFEKLQQRKPSAQALADAHPGSAACQYAAAYIQLRLLITEAQSMADALAACDQRFQRALAALPDYPRARYQYSRFKTDLGAGRESIELAIGLRDRFPHHPLAYGALAYAARNAGLLDGAKEALAARESLVGGLAADPGLGENTWLYLGDLDRFERSLVGEQGHPIRQFYRGYARLLRGDRAGALAAFQASRLQPGRVIQFESLSEVYELALLGRQEEALARLRRLLDTRQRLRVPDGEFTFKIAEAFAFLGAYPEAVETASSGFTQGFGCTRWYRHAPFLQPVQSLPRWQGLLSHLEEREALLRDRYPARRFRRG